MVPKEDKGMSTYSDLVLDGEESDILDRMGVYGTKTYPSSPGQCVECNESDLKALEILGALNKPLFWLCRGCGYLHMIYTREYTTERLMKAEGLFTHPDFWIKDGVD